MEAIDACVPFLIQFDVHETNVVDGALGDNFTGTIPFSLQLILNWTLRFCLNKIIGLSMAIATLA